MKNIFWKISLSLSMLFMITGFGVSLHGLHEYDYNLVYTGLAIIGVTCASWWIWVMLVIKQMYDVTHTAITGVSDIRSGIKEVKELISEYKTLSER